MSRVKFIGTSDNKKVFLFERTRCYGEASSIYGVQFYCLLLK